MAIIRLLVDGILSPGGEIPITVAKAIQIVTVSPHIVIAWVRVLWSCAEEDTEFPVIVLEALKYVILNIDESILCVFISSCLFSNSETESGMNLTSMNCG
jgi:hypothetical protein